MEDLGGGMGMTQLTDYTIVIRPDDNSTFAACVPAIPGCHAWGRTPDEARSELVHVFEMIRDRKTKRMGIKLK